ncbi:MAG: beta-glucanase, partial [Verrucomicrobiota bacterium]
MMLTSFAASAVSLTAFTPGELWPDDQGVPINAHGGGMLFHKGVYYWFGEHKIEGKAGNVAQVGVSVYSSRDLYNWKNEGVALAVSGTPGDPLEKGCIIERPKV